MRVGSAVAERVDASTASGDIGTAPVDRRPRDNAGGNPELPAVKVNIWVGVVKVERWRDGGVMESHDRLDHGGKTGCTLKMS